MVHCKRLKLCKNRELVELNFLRETGSRKVMDKERCKKAPWGSEEMSELWKSFPSPNTDILDLVDTG